MSFALCFALKLIYLRLNHDFWPQQVFYVDKDPIEKTHEYNTLRLVFIHMDTLSHLVKGEDS
jgi:hypothetical protein